jgi:hypothetical protein
MSALLDETTRRLVDIRPPENPLPPAAQKSSGTSTRSVLKLFTVATNAGEAFRANHEAEHHL